MAIKIETLNLSQIRQEILKLPLVICSSDFPAQASNIYAYPSRICLPGSVGDRCGFCETPHWNQSMSPQLVEQTLDIFRSSHAQKLVLTGGGEPTAAKERTLDFFRNIPEGAVIELQTAGQWAYSVESARRFLEQISDATLNKETEFRLRVSIGRYVQKKIPVDNVINVIRGYESRNFPFKLFFHSAYVDTDQTVEQIAYRLGGKIDEHRPYDLRRSTITSAAGYTYTVNYTNLRQPYRFLTADEYQRFQNGERVVLTIDDIVKPLQDDKGDFSLGMCLNDPQGKGMVPSVGVNLTIDVDGSTTIFGGSSPDNVGNIAFQNFPALAQHFTRDIITLALLRGVLNVVRIAALFKADVIEKAKLQNDPPAFVEQSLCTPVLRGAVSLVLLYDYSTAQEGFIDPQLLSPAIKTLLKLPREETIAIIKKANEQQSS